MIKNTKQIISKTESGIKVGTKNWYTTNVIKQMAIIGTTIYDCNKVFLIFLNLIWLISMVLTSSIEICPYAN